MSDRSPQRHNIFTAVAASGALLLVLLVSGAAHAQAPELPPVDAGYPLDQLERVINAAGRVRCPKVTKVRYRGDVIAYHSPVVVNPYFRERLRRFEVVVRDVALEVYGRAPRQIRHVGTYNCRRIAAWPTFLSEHGLANGIDVAGFDFGPAPRASRSTTPRAVRGAFSVRLARHWQEGRTGAAALHSRFLRLLVRRLIARQDIFRVLLGPVYPGHKDHFHFDCSPWRMVEVFQAPDSAL